MSSNAPEVISHALEYELDASPRCSLETISDSKNLPDLTQATLVEHQPEPTVSLPPLSPSIRLLFSLITPKQRCLLLFPALLSSIISGGIAPFFTLVIGQVFDAFAKFPREPNPPQEAKDKLLRVIGLASFELIGLAAGSILLSSLTSCLWIWTGELNTLSLRKRVYGSVTHKEMAWFDTNAGSEAPEDGPLGAGGLMAKFTRETDDVRNASSLASGMVVQYLTTCITCLILAFMRSWALTLVILSAMPALMIIQAASQIIVGPILAEERGQTGIAGTLIDRAVNAISTVKAFNAEKHEQSALATVLSRMKYADRKLNAVWGATSTLSQFVMMSMFVQGFWFGAKLVREKTIAAGDVMAVFWACLIATSNLQMCIPQFIIINKGKFAMSSLLSLVDPLSPSPAPSSPSVPSTMSLRQPHRSEFRKIVPIRCPGEIALHDVTFAYPSRPTIPVLKNVSLYLPANETTFICGGSGSGKSTIAQLLLRLYKPQSGTIQLDDQDLEYLDENWTHERLAAVSQGCILFDMSVHDNVAMGLAGAGNRKPEDVTRQEVVEACTAALIHEFIRDLPDGYDTKLGTGGSNLSGGQRQRIAIARAKIRDPSILILDEATSALDPTSRILVFEAIKHWRAQKTTIVITHDLSQITSTDFVYVLKDGEVVEQGYRYDLETSSGEFYHMMTSQGATGGFVPTLGLDSQASTDDVEAILHQDVEKRVGGIGEAEEPRFAFPTGEMLALPPPNLAMSNWMFEAVADLTIRNAPSPTFFQQRNSLHLMHSQPTTEDTELVVLPKRVRRASSIQVLPSLPPLTIPKSRESRRYTLQHTPISPTFHPSIHACKEVDDDFDEKAFLKEIYIAPLNDRKSKRLRARTLSAPNPPFLDEKDEHPVVIETPPQDMSLGYLLREIYPTIPYKAVVVFGLIVCVLSGAMTPVFSFLLSRLLYEVSIGATDVSIINMFGGIVLGAAAFDGLMLGLKFFIMESSAMLWVNSIRNSSFQRVLAQDKKWFDKSEHSPVRLVQILIKDGDEARNLIAIVLGQAVVVTSMLSVGLIWALVRGWQMTLVGFAIAPVFAAIMAIQTKLVSRCEMNNKRAREDVAKIYYEAISNIRGIRSMSLETIFERQFNNSTDLALKAGVKGAFVEGCTFGVASGIIYLAEALLFYVGAIFIARGTYTYLQMVEVLNLVVFTVTIGSQLMSFTDKIAKSIQATREFNELLRLPTDTDESHGHFTPAIDGSVLFNEVHFSYPERPDVPVLKGMNFEIIKGESVAIVGTSGSGKSTVAALLQRLYEPRSGSISVGSHNIRSTAVHHLRHHVAVVSQNPHLFDASISDNIIYGNKSITEFDVRTATKAAKAHDFIMTLPQGYDTKIGENNSLISGGQAQRLQIARALARPSNIMILDECTSALDSANQAAVMEAIYQSRAGNTLVMITHKLPLMKQCDRILVVHDGRIAEHGSYSELMDRKGLFASLTTGGEWVGE